jgi:hypothetical protein
MTTDKLAQAEEDGGSGEEGKGKGQPPWVEGWPANPRSGQFFFLFWQPKQFFSQISLQPKIAFPARARPCKVHTLDI